MPVATTTVKSKGQSKLRETALMIATGQMGVGKSFITEQMIPDYLSRHYQTRKILIYDINNEFGKFKTVLFDVEEIQAAKQMERKLKRRILTPTEKRIAQLAPGQIRRVVPFTKHGYGMNTAQKRLTFEVLLEQFNNGLLHFEDINKYISSFQDDKVTGAFKAIRHNSQDIILHMQSMNPVRPLLLEAASAFRMHYDGIDLNTTKFDARFGSHAEILRLAQLVVFDEFLNQNNPRFFCYVYHKTKKLRGITAEQFERAAAKYLILHKGVIQLAALETAHANKRMKPNFNDLEKAKFQWIKQRKEMYLS